MASFDPETRRFINVELKGYIDTNEKLDVTQIVEVKTTNGQFARVRVYSKKNQPGHPMGKFRYLVGYEGPS